MDTILNFVNERPWGLRQKLWFKTFPYRILEQTEPCFEVKDVLIVKTYTQFDFADRLRILLTGKIQTWSQTYCENTLGRVKTDSVVNVLTKFEESHVPKR